MRVASAAVLAVAALAVVALGDELEPVPLAKEVGLCGENRGIGVQLGEGIGLVSDSHTASTASVVVFDLAFNYEEEDASVSAALLRLMHATFPAEGLLFSITSPTTLVTSFQDGDGDLSVNPGPENAVDEFFSRLLVIVDNSANEFTVWHNNVRHGSQGFPGFPTGSWNWKFRVNIDARQGEDLAPNEWVGILDHLRVYEGNPTEEDIATLFATNTEEPPGELTLFQGWEFGQTLAESDGSGAGDWNLFGPEEDVEPEVTYACGRYSTWFDRNTALAIIGSCVAFILTGALAYYITSRFVMGRPPAPTVPRRAGDRAYTGKLATGKPKKDRTAPPSYRMNDPQPEATEAYATLNGPLPPSEPATPADDAPAELPTTPATDASGAPLAGARSGSPRKSSPRKKRHGSGSRRKRAEEGGSGSGSGRGSRRDKGKGKKKGSRRDKKPAADPVVEDEEPAADSTALLDLPSSAALPSYDQYVSSKKAPADATPDLEPVDEPEPEVAEAGMEGDDE